MSMAMTEGVGWSRTGPTIKRNQLKLEFIDVKRAFFHAEARREVYVDLPEEDGTPGMCGKLVKAMYGTRDAPQNWEFEYVGFLDSIGFQPGKTSPCVFYHEPRNIRLVVHGDDFTALGTDPGLNWFRQQMTNRFECKIRGRLGPEKGDDKEIRILHRILTWKSDGIHYEADQRHAEIIIRDLGLDRQTTKQASTPCVKHGELEEESNTMELE